MLINLEFINIRDGKVVILILYINDILLIWNDVEILSLGKLLLKAIVGEANNVLGIRILRDHKNKFTCLIPRNIHE